MSELRANRRSYLRSKVAAVCYFRWMQKGKRLRIAVMEWWFGVCWRWRGCSVWEEKVSSILLGEEAVMAGCWGGSWWVGAQQLWLLCPSRGASSVLLAVLCCTCRRRAALGLCSPPGTSKGVLGTPGRPPCSLQVGQPAEQGHFLWKIVIFPVFS